MEKSCFLHGTSKDNMNILDECIKKDKKNKDMNLKIRRI